jgi:hypothetical protein
MRPLVPAALAVACLTVSGCAGFGLPSAGSASINDTILKIATDPNCGHSDELHVILGAVPSGTIDVKRICDPVKPPAAVAVAAPAAVTP